MKMRNRFLLPKIAVITAYVTGCAGLPTVSNRDVSPREAALLFNERLAPALASIEALCVTGLMSDATRDAVSAYGHELRFTVGTYAETARPCEVREGRLTSDPKVGLACQRGSVRAASQAMPEILKKVGLVTGGETGQRLYLAGTFAALYFGQNAAVPLDGFESDQDVPLADYDAAWRATRASADRLAACVAEETSL